MVRFLSVFILSLPPAWFSFSIFNLIWATWVYEPTLWIISKSTAFLYRFTRLRAPLSEIKPCTPPTPFALDKVLTKSWVEAASCPTLLPPSISIRITQNLVTRNWYLIRSKENSFFNETIHWSTLLLSSIPRSIVIVWLRLFPLRIIPGPMSSAWGSMPCCFRLQVFSALHLGLQAQSLSNIYSHTAAPWP